jgi:catechol 2,3-dioxygenase-like lactoylglutathione lyase family enzyme
MIRLDHFVIQVSDYDSAVEFYRQVFQFAEFAEVPDPAGDASIGFRQADGLTIWIEDSEGRSIKPLAGSLNHYAFHCDNRQDVDAAYQFCRDRKWNTLGEPKAYPRYGDFYGFAFEGPDQLKLEFLTR